MNTKHFISRFCILAALVVLVLGFATGSASATSAGTAFTYQGQLIQGGSPVTASCDFKFSLYDALARGNQVGSTNTLTGVTVASGLFTVQLDFGTTAFKGEARWLEIAVKCGSELIPTTLAPRQPLTPAPYALYANTATNFSGALTGDANGTQDSTHVTALRGVAIAATAPTNGQVLQYTGSQWAPASALSGLWSLTGNSGTDPLTNFLGTLDNVALEFRVNNSRALRLEPNATSPNILGGYSGNILNDGVYGAVIGGGGLSGALNRVTDIFGVVSGGANNRAGDDAGTILDRAGATVGGGESNIASGNGSTVGGGGSNIASNSGATVGGGDGNAARGAGAFIGGGGYDGTANNGNTADANASTIAGGWGNQVTVDAYYATIGGGHGNTASGAGAFIGGGGYDGHYNNGNTAAADASTIAGGTGNQVTVDAYYATIGGGYENIASGDSATIGGGYWNIASGDLSTVAGGFAASATHYGEMAYASGKLYTKGDAQASEYVLRNKTHNANQTELFLDAGNQRITLASNRTLSFDILIVAHSDSGASAGYQIKGLIENVNGTTAFVGNPTVTVLGEDVAAWDVVAKADDTNDALVILVTGDSTNIFWVASVRTVEVGW